MDNRKNEQIMELMYKEAKIMLTEICPENVDLNKYFNLEMPKISELLLLQLEVILDKKYGRYYVQFLM